MPPSPFLILIACLLFNFFVVVQVRRQLRRNRKKGRGGGHAWAFLPSVWKAFSLRQLGIVSSEFPRTSNCNGPHNFRSSLTASQDGPCARNRIHGYAWRDKKYIIIGINEWTNEATNQFSKLRAVTFRRTLSLFFSDTLCSAWEPRFIDSDNLMLLQNLNTRHISCPLFVQDPLYKKVRGS